MGYKEYIWWSSWSITMIFQIITGIFRYNPNGFDILRLVGGGIMVIGFVLGFMGVSTLKRMGEIPEEKGLSDVSKSRGYGIGTTVLVSSGIYSTVRHPQYLCWIFFNAAVSFIAQDWLVAIFGVAAMITIYMQALQDDQSLLEKFSDDYNRYMQNVPRINILLGVYRRLRHQKHE